MGKTNKAPRNLKAAKQLTLNNLPELSKKEFGKPTKQIQEKRIVIIDIDALKKEDELALKVSFKLFPSKTAFSKVKMDLWFDNQKINSHLIRILQGPLSADELELPLMLDMKGVAAGSHAIRVEMFELWSDEEKLASAQREITIDYIPEIKESRLIKLPTVKSIGGRDVEVISESDKNIYREIEETTKKESAAKRDQW